MKYKTGNIKRALSTSVATIALGWAGYAGAAEFDVNDDFSITTNVTVSAGVTVRTENRSSESIFSGNGAAIGVAGRAQSATQDDGNLNFDKGDLVSAPFTALADIEFNYRDDIGFFLRGKAVFDAVLENKRVPHGHAPNGYARGQRLDDEGFNTKAQFSNVDILDAFAFYNTEIADTPVEFRVGRQVVSWGEGVFIQNGINSINPVDVSAFRRPGVQLKEGLVPLGMLYANVGATDNLSIEGFWNFEWQQTQLDGCGTFFSTADVIAQGCNQLSLASVGQVVGPLVNAQGAAGVAALTPAIAQVQAAIQAAGNNQQLIAVLQGQLTALQTQLGQAQAIANNDFSTDEGSSNAIALATTGGFFVPRSADIGPDDFSGDQFGIAARYYVDEIDTEFGLFFTRLDSRTPILGFTEGSFVAAPGNLPALGVTPGAATYFAEYPESINTLGISAAGTFFGVALAGEFSYRPNHPVQINTNDLTLAAITQGQSLAFNGTTNPADALFQNGTGSRVSGFIETNQLRGQASAVAFFDRVLGADRITAIGELGFEWLPSLDSDNPLGLNLGRASVYGNPNSAGNTAEGLTTEFSAGFRGRVSASYSNVFLGVNMTPSLSFAQDLVGQSSDGQFIEGRTSLGFGLAFDYLNRYTLALNYTTSFGGAFNAFDDRDFASAVVSVQF